MAVSSALRHSPFAVRPLAVLCMLSAAAIPAEDQKPVTASTVVTAIEIPVTVVGKDGKPIGGLEAKNFELTDDGKKQTITAVDVIDLRSKSAAEIPGPARRHWLLVFDLTYSSPKGLARAKEGAADFVKSSTSESDLVGVATLSAETGWKLLLNFSNDRQQLAEPARRDAHIVDGIGVVQISLMGGRLVVPHVAEPRQ